jgi:hypothetical protein
VKVVYEKFRFLLLNTDSILINASPRFALSRIRRKRKKKVFTSRYWKLSWRNYLLARKAGDGRVIACTFFTTVTRDKCTHEWYSLEKLDLPLSWRSRYYFILCDDDSTATIDTLIYRPLSNVHLHQTWHKSICCSLYLMTPRPLIPKQFDTFLL